MAKGSVPCRNSVLSGLWMLQKLGGRNAVPEGCSYEHVFNTRFSLN